MIAVPPRDYSCSASVVPSGGRQAFPVAIVGPPSRPFLPVRPRVAPGSACGVARRWAQAIDFRPPAAIFHPFRPFQVEVAQRIFVDDVLYLFYSHAKAEHRDQEIRCVDASIALHPAENPRKRSLGARRAARRVRFERERLIVDSLNRGLSVVAIAQRLGVTENGDMRALGHEIARRPHRRSAGIRSRCGSRPTRRCSCLARSPAT